MFTRLAAVLLMFGAPGLGGAARAQFGVASPFTVTAEPVVHDGQPAVAVTFDFAPPVHLTASMLAVTDAQGSPLTPLHVPPPARKPDPITGEPAELYESGFTAVYARPPPTAPAEIRVCFQGCDHTTCFMPETRSFTLAQAAGGPSDGTGTPGPAPTAPATSSGADWRAELDHFEIVATQSGYQKSDAFLEFLQGHGAESADAAVQRRGWIVTLLLIFGGGLLLNLTPCVLPMIPINLAIIGAGAQASSKGRGFLLGGVYGAGMALAYGALGLIVVLTGSSFGALNASPWFNAAIAVLFVVLALAMFDVLHIDFSGLQARLGAGGGNGGLAVAFSAGVIAALLAGACVAPVLIFVLVLAGTLYAQGNIWGLTLPFLLGLGMALPWPFAGAGLSRLPKPGGWMNGVKKAFGALILLVGLYYGHVAYSLFRTAAVSATAPANAETERLAAALRDARAAGKTVFVDFWATWCKNCLAMEETTFKDARVAERLKDFAVMKFQAESPNDPATAVVLKRLGVKGLPTYLLLKPK